MSPYVRHGLLTLPELLGRRGRRARRATGASYRDELLWQEYARHLYARVGADLGRVAAPRAAAGRRAVGRAVAARHGLHGRTSSAT